MCLFLVKPFFIQRLQNRSSVYRHDSLVQFSCVVGGKPSPSIEWYYNGNPLQTQSGYDAYYEIVDKNLTISHPSKDNEGWYSCKAENKVGSVSLTAFLKVYGKRLI